MEAGRTDFREMAARGRSDAHAAHVPGVTRRAGRRGGRGCLRILEFAIGRPLDRGARTIVGHLLLSSRQLGQLEQLRLLTGALAAAGGAITCGSFRYRGGEDAVGVGGAGRVGGDLGAAVGGRLLLQRV